MAKPVRAPRSIAAIQIEWGACAGSQKGQYRLGHAEVGVLLTALAEVTDDYHRVHDAFMDIKYPGAGKRIATASDAATESK